MKTDPNRIPPTKQEMISLLKLRRIQWYGWGGRPENLSRVRESFTRELRVWCSEHGTILSEHELTDVLKSFYKAVGW